MMKNLFQMTGWKGLTKAIAILCCLTLTVNQTFAQCDAGTVTPPVGAPVTVCPGSPDVPAEITAAPVDIPTSEAAMLYGRYDVVITDGTSTVTVIYEGAAGDLLVPGDVTGATIEVAADGTVSEGTASTAANVTIQGDNPLPNNGATYTIQGFVFVGSVGGTVGGTPSPQDACATPDTGAPQDAFDVQGNFLTPSGINPLDNYFCITPDVAQIAALAATGTAPYEVNSATEVYTDATLGTAYVAGDALAFDDPPLFVPANTNWELIVQDASGCTSVISGQFETPQAQILALSNDYCQFDPAVTIFGDPNGAPYIGPVVDPTDPLANDLPIGVFEDVPLTGSITDNGDNSAIFDPALAAPGQMSVFFTVEVGLAPNTCEIIDEQIINIYPYLPAAFDGETADNPNPLPVVVCQGEGGGAITIEPDELTELIEPTFLQHDNANEFYVIQNGDFADEVEAYVSFEGTGITNNFDGTAEFDTNQDPGTYTITLRVGYDQCATYQSHSVTIVDAVDATLQAYTLCGQENGGQVDLTAMFDGATPGGTFGADAGTVDGDVLTYCCWFFW